MGTDISYIWRVGVVHGEEGKGVQLLFNASQGAGVIQSVIHPARRALTFDFF